MAEIRLIDITKRFGRTVAVDQMNLEVNDGEFVVFLGPSGCGKTTTLRAVAGLEYPESGDIFIDGTRVNDLRPADRDIAFVFQFYALYPHLTVYENIAFPLRAMKMDKVDIERQVRAVAKILHIDESLKRKPYHLSGGEMQRVALGRAMVRRPKVFLMDEPLTNLDAKLRIEMRAELKHLQHELGATTIYVTHDQIEAMSLGDRIAVMNDGKLQQIGSPEEVYHRPVNLFVAGFMGSPPMNLLNAHIEDGEWIQIENTPVRFALPAEARETASANGHRLVLGIRPENVILGTDPEGVQVPVHLVEPLGSDTLVDLRLGEYDGTPILMKARIPPTRSVVEGQFAQVQLQSAYLNLFDQETEQILWRH